MRLLPFTLLLVAACDPPSVAFVPDGPPVAAPRDPQSVQLLTAPPARPFTVAGLITTHAGQNHVAGEMPAHQAALLREAAARGCEAVYLDAHVLLLDDGLPDSRTGLLFAIGERDALVFRGYRAQCLRYVAEAAAPTAIAN